MKKLLYIIVACFMLTGCASDSTDTSNGTFTVGMECNYAPFNWQTSVETETSVSLGGDAGYCDGYDVRVASAIADSLGKELVVKKISWDGLTPALNAGEIDAIIAGMTANEEREQGIDFTTPYYSSEMVMIVRSSDEELTQYDDIQQFTNKIIIGQKNTNYDAVIDQIEGVIHATPRSSYPEMVVALQNGEVDGITAELPVAESILASNSDLTIVRFAEGKNFDIDTSVSIGLKEGTRDTEFFQQVQAALDDISEETRNEWMQEANAVSSSDIPEGFIQRALWIFQNNAPLLWDGIKNTLILAISGTGIGLIIGLFLGGIRAVQVEQRDKFIIRVLKRISQAFVSIYVWFVRGTPMMVQALLFYYTLRPFLGWTPFVAGIVIISLNTGAYMAEIVRSGIQSVDKGQVEGARSLGMTSIQTMYYIVLPQAIRNAFPSIGNEFIVNIKDSCMLNVIGVTELMFQSSSIAGSVFMYENTYLITTIMYLILTSITTIILHWLEQKISLQNRGRTGGSLWKRKKS